MKKHIIWSNANLKLEDWKEVFEEENIIDEDEQYEKMYEFNNYYLDDERRNLKNICTGKILVIADLGLWNGRKQGYKILNSCKDIFYSDCDYLEWYVDVTGLHCIASHHDGTNNYEYREIREGVNIDNLLDKIYNGKKISKNYLNRYTKNLWLPIKNVYGF